MDQLTKDFTQNIPVGSNGRFNPFPGLRPFGMEESHLFFGREGQSEEVLEKLSSNKFVAIIGASGTGKSSLIYCGLIPILHGGFIAQAGSNWKTIVTRPGSNPVENLAISLNNASGNKNDQGFDHPFFAAILRRSNDGISESLKYISKGQENILLLVDQFEELFRYRINRNLTEAQNDAVTFVRLLVEAVNQNTLPIYVVLTMRSDFIGECSHYQELTSLINKSNYLIPQMTRSDFGQAITGPVAVGGAEIEPDLVEHLLNDVGDNPDQLPILQHAMMRTWDYWERNTDQSKPLSIADYEAIGKMERALSEHANEAFDELDEEGKWVCEVLFKTITEKGTDNRGVRRPTKLESLAQIAGSTTESVIKVIEKFRQPGRSFITPAYPIALNKDSIVDLSHESLMRIWNRLRNWVDEESLAVQMYNRLSEASALFQEGKTGLWRPPDLQLALNWEKKKRPTLEWAQRHNPAFERVMVFLHSSEKEYEADEQNKLKIQKRTLRRTRLFAIVLGVFSIVALGMFIFANVQKQEADKQRLEATQQKTLADKKSQEALNEKKNAEFQASEALKQKELATQQSQIAETQREIALRNQKFAEIQQQAALENAQLANKQREAADSARQDALLQQMKAEKASNEAYNRRILSISQSMAVKSLQNFEDNDLQSLLALQSYIFNNKFNGPKHNADVYAALYNALLNKKGVMFSHYPGHNNTVYAIKFNPLNNDFYSTGSEGKIFKWNTLDSTHQSQMIYDSKTTNRSLDISTDGKILACAANGQGILVIELSKQPYVIATYNNAGVNVSSVAFSKDNTTLLASNDKNLYKINLADGKAQLIATADSQIISLTVSKQADLVAFGTKSGKVQMIPYRKSNELVTLINEPKNQFAAVSFNTQGTRLATGDENGFLRVWDVENNQMINSSRLNKATITSISYNQDNSLIASSVRDGSVLIWDANDLNTQPFKLTDHNSWALTVSFSNTGDLLASGSFKGNRLLVRSAVTKNLAEILQSSIRRNFTQEEWKIYVGQDIPYETTIQIKKETKIKVKESN